MCLINDMVQNIVIDPLPNKPTSLAMKYLPLTFLNALRHLSGEHWLPVFFHIQQVLNLALPCLIICTIQRYHPASIHFHLSPQETQQFAQANQGSDTTLLGLDSNNALHKFTDTANMHTTQPPLLVMNFEDSFNQQVSSGITQTTCTCDTGFNVEKPPQLEE